MSQASLCALFFLVACVWGLPLSRHYPPDGESVVPDKMPAWGIPQTYSLSYHPGSRHDAATWMLPERLYVGFGELEDDDSYPALDDLWEYSFDNEMYRWISGNSEDGSYKNHYSDYVPSNEYASEHNPSGRLTATTWIGQSPSDTGAGGTIILFGGNLHNITYSTPTFHNPTGVRHLFDSTNDLWEFNTAISVWRELQPHNDSLDWICDRSPDLSTVGSECPWRGEPNYLNDLPRGEFRSWIQPPPVSGACAVSTLTGDRVFMYGGLTRTSVAFEMELGQTEQHSATSTSNALWQYDIGTNQWRLLHNGVCGSDEYTSCTRTSTDLKVPFGVYNDTLAPMGRSSTSCWGIGDDAFVMYGGDLNRDMFLFNATVMEWKVLVATLPHGYPRAVADAGDGVFHEGNTPGARNGAAAWLAAFPDSDPDDTFFVLFGGLTLEVLEWYIAVNETLPRVIPSSDPLLWVFSVKLEMWSYYNISGELQNEAAGGNQDAVDVIAGGALEAHTRMYVPHAGVPDGSRMVFVGGPREGYTGLLDDVWTVDIFAPFCGAHATFVNDTGQEECVCHLGYSGPTCRTYSCYGVDSKDYGTVCSGKGVCGVPGECVCYPHAAGDQCETHQCYAFSSTDDQPGQACGGAAQGYCGFPDLCTCVDGFHGRECLEMIVNGAVYEGDPLGPQTIIVDYVTPLSVAAKYNGECSQLIQNMEILGTSLPRCFFVGEYESQMTSSLTIHTNPSPNRTVESGVVLYLFPLTAKDPEDEVVSLILEEMKEKPVLSSGAIIAIVLSIIFLVCVAGVIGGIVLTVGCIYRKRILKQRQILNFFELEQGAAGSGGTTHRTPLKFSQLAQTAMEIKYRDLDVKEVIGRGGSNSVIFRVIYADKECAFKCFRLSDLGGESDVEEFEKEVSILASVKHPHVLQFFGVCLEANRVGLVMEFCGKGSLKTHFDKKPARAKGVGFVDVLRMLAEIASALDYLHKREIVHRDIKSENILLDDFFQCKLIDFGASKVFAAGVEKTMHVGTSVYMAPEVVQGTGYSSQCDIFSLGIVLYEMLTRDCNPYGANQASFNIEFRVALDPSFRPDVTGLLKSLPRENRWIVPLMQLCWSHEPAMRPPAGELYATVIKKRMGQGGDDDGDVASPGQEDNEGRSIVGRHEKERRISKRRRAAEAARSSSNTMAGQAQDLLAMFEKEGAADEDTDEVSGDAPEGEDGAREGDLEIVEEVTSPMPFGGGKNKDHPTVEKEKAVFAKAAEESDGDNGVTVAAGEGD